MTGRAPEKVQLAAFWLPPGGLDERIRSRLAGTQIRPILGRGVGSGVGDCALLPGLPPTAEPLAEPGGGDNQVLYWRRFATHPDRDSRFDLAPYLFAVRVFAGPQWQQPIRNWLDQEHFERQTAMDGVLFSEGYEPEEGEFHFLNLWAINSPDLVDSAEWAEVRQTPWWDEVLPGFQVSTVHREVYRVEKVA